MGISRNRSSHDITGRYPSGENSRPRYSIVSWKNFDFYWLMIRPHCLSLSKTAATCLRCWSTSSLNIMTSSIYTKRFFKPYNTMLMKRWKQFGAVFIPNGILQYTSRPHGVAMAVLCLSASLINTCWKPFSNQVWWKHSLEYVSLCSQFAEWHICPVWWLHSKL